MNQSRQPEPMVKKTFENVSEMLKHTDKLKKHILSNRNNVLSNNHLLRGREIETFIRCHKGHKGHKGLMFSENVENIGGTLIVNNKKIIKKSTNSLIKNLKKFSKLFKKSKYIIAGGIFCKLLNGQICANIKYIANLESTDIDVFPSDNKILQKINNDLQTKNSFDVFEILNTILKGEIVDRKNIEVLRTDFAITIKIRSLRCPIQLILASANPATVLFGFDISVCQICVYDGELYMTPECVLSMMDHVIYVRGIMNSCTMHQRLTKYFNRGYNLFIKDYDQKLLSNEYRIFNTIDNKQRRNNNGINKTCIEILRSIKYNRPYYDYRNANSFYEKYYSTESYNLRDNDILPNYSRSKLLNKSLKLLGDSMYSSKGILINKYSIEDIEDIRYRLINISFNCIVKTIVMKSDKKNKSEIIKYLISNKENIKNILNDESVINIGFDINDDMLTYLIIIWDTLKCIKEDSKLLDIMKSDKKNNINNIILNSLTNKTWTKFKNLDTKRSYPMLNILRRPSDFHLLFVNELKDKDIEDFLNMNDSLNIINQLLDFPPGLINIVIMYYMGITVIDPRHY